MSKTTSIFTALLALAPCFPVVQAADRASGWYVTATAGFAAQSDQRFDLTASDGSTTTEEVPLDDGFLAGAAIGRDFGNGWRTEAEFIYQTVDHPFVAFEPSGPAGNGNYASTSVALNALYEFSLFGSDRVRTYVGAGVAYLTEVDIDFESAGVEDSYSGSDWGYQLLLGARYDLNSRAFLDAGIRYLSATDVKLDPEGSATGSLRADYEPLALTVSFGWRF